MMAERTLVSGSIFTNAKPTLDQMVSDLQSEVRRLQAQLVDEQRMRAEAEANVARLERNEKLRADPHPPTGDRDKGYRCSCCGAEIEWPFEQTYCGNCGKGIDWRCSMPDGDEDAFDRWFDR